MSALKGLSSCTRQSHQNACHAGDVGLLAEEGVQRLLSVFSEFAMACLQQIHSMCLQHDPSKYERLQLVGLDLVQRWDSNVTQEETARIETAYPEITTLHSFACLWLLDHLCSDRDLARACLPSLADTYALFMKRVVCHIDVKRGKEFLLSSELHRRAVFVAAFRGAYHDAMAQCKNTPRRADLALQFPARHSHHEPLVMPEEAASHSGSDRRQRIIAHVMPPNSSSKCENATDESGSSCTPHQPSALQLAMREAHPANTLRLPPEITENGLSRGKQLPGVSNSNISGKSKEISVNGPCFFPVEASTAAS